MFPVFAIYLSYENTALPTDKLSRGARLVSLPAFMQFNKSLVLCGFL
jgi:hypothetical protein